MMKKLFCLIAILVIAVSAVSPVLAAPPAGEPQPQQPVQQNAGKTLYLPLARRPVTYYQVSGQVKDANDTPISGVTVSSDTGTTAKTDANGVYTLQALGGQRQITAAYAGKYFDPQPAWLTLAADAHNVNFTAGAACVVPTANPSFETILYWNPISGLANGYTPFYTYSRAHTGSYSGYTGIPVGYENLPSASRWRSHEIYIPTDVTSVTITMYVWPRTTETTLALREEGDAAAADLSGYNTDSPDYPLADDWQYAYATDANNNWLSTLWQIRRNDQSWLQVTTNLATAAFAGRTIKLEFGSINDGIGGVTSAFFDDVSVTVCRSGTGPINTTCTNPTNILLNSDFETLDTGWTISPAVRPSLYETTGNFFYSPVTSMQSGMPLASTPPAGIWTTSEFYQYVTIPTTATRAILSARLLPQSTDRYGYNIYGQQQLDAALKETQARGESPLMPDAWEGQYGYICANGQCGPNPTTLATLFHWYPIDARYWLYRAWDLTAWRGQTIGILFGAQDFGDAGNTALYVDDATLMVCP